MSHLKLHFTLHTWQSSHSTLHTSHCTLRTPHFTLHTAHFTVHTSHCTLRTPNVTLHSPHFTLHTALFLPHTSHCTLHLIWALLTLSQLSSSHLISSHMSSKLSWITSHYYYKGTCMRSAPARPVRACFVRSCCNVVVQKHDLRRCWKITSAKVEKICWQITVAAWMQPFQYELRCSAAKDNSITAAAAPSNLDICRDWVAKHNRTTRNGVGNCSFKTGSRRQSRKKTILKHFLKWFLERKLLAPKLRKSAAKSLSQPGCSHSNTIYAVQLQKTIVLRMQPRHQATLTQPLQCDLQRLSCKTQ